MIRSANRKLRKSEATNKSCRNNFWNRANGRQFQAIVSVIAVKIQLSSPNTVLRSAKSPGILMVTDYSGELNAVHYALEYKYNNLIWVIPTRKYI